LVPGAPPIELIDYYPDFTSYYPECELQTKRWFVENVKPSWVVFDVGANIGYYSILFSRLAPAGRVFAFEPTETIEKLNRNLAHHGCTNVTSLRRALGAVAGTLEEDVYRIWGKPPERQKYSFSTVDVMIQELHLQALNCVKIDVDSFDFEVLQGARETLARFDPWVVVELNHALARRNHSPSEAFQWMLEQGYNEALVLDYDNFVFRRSNQKPGVGRPTLELTFDTKPLFLGSSRVKSAERTPLFDSTPRILESGRIESSAPPLRIEVRGPRWTYAAEWSLADQPLDPILVEIEALAEGASVAFSFIGLDGTTILEETTLGAGTFLQTVCLPMPKTTPVKGLLLRNVDMHGATGHVSIFRIRCFDSVPAPPYSPPPVLRPSTSKLSSHDMLRALSGDGDVRSDGDGIDIVAVEDLGQALGFSIPFIPNRLYRHELARFNTERDETPIFSYIYGTFKPRRHLEIGTWEGHGVTTIARVSDAEIWTVNLPDGERDTDGTSKYPTDSGPVIGRLYREAGFSPRVHQILCDSLDLDFSQWGPGFFDTIFIDGGHTASVVASDTEKTLPLLRSGGLMLWHDFCPEPQTLLHNEAPRGVVTAIAENLPRWRSQFSKIFWIRPSWILVGIKHLQKH
jgi:FkbM family methyltransferase